MRRPLPQQTVSELTVGAVSFFCEIELEEMLDNQAKRPAVSDARRLCWYIMRRHFNFTYPECAAPFGGNHTSVMYAIRKFEQQSKTTKGLKRDAQRLAKLIRGRMGEAREAAMEGWLMNDD